MTYSKKLCCLLSALCSGFMMLASPLSYAQSTTDVEITEGSMTVVSSRRVSRTSIEVVLNASVTNASTNQFLDVSAILTATPANVSVIDGELSFGDIEGSSTTNSLDTVTLRVNLRGDPSGSYVWQVSGEEVVPPPPPPDDDPTHPTMTGVFVLLEGVNKNNWLPFASWQQGSGRSVSTGTGGVRETSTLAISDMALTRVFDENSVPLSDAFLKGTFFSEIKVIVRARCGAAKFYTAYEMTIADGILTSLSRAGNNEAVYESLAINMGSLDTIIKTVDNDCRLIDTTYSYQDFN